MSTKSVFGKRKGGGRRSAARAAAPLMAVVSTVAASRSAEVVDVSSTGVRLQGDHLPHLGDELSVNMEGVTAFGMVVWEHGTERGVQFDSPLDVVDDQTLREKIIKAGGVSAERRAAIDDWTLGVAR